MIPILETTRLSLRPFTLKDAPEVQRMAGSPKVAATTGNVPHPYPDGAAEEWISKHADWFEKKIAVNWAIELKSEKKLIGSMSLGISSAHLKAEIGYWLGEEYWNKGYCTEAALLAVDFAFKNLELNKVTSRYLSINPSSGRVMQKIGMSEEGYLKKDFCKNGELVDLIVYGLLKKDFTAAAAVKLEL